MFTNNSPIPLAPCSDPRSVALSCTVYVPPAARAPGKRTSESDDVEIA